MKLNQIIALMQGKKQRAKKALETIHRGWDQTKLTGISKTYRPRDEDGVQHPPESKEVQLRVGDSIRTIENVLTDLFNGVYEQEEANTRAKADIKVGDKVIASQVPVTVLLFLEKQVVDLITMAKAFPVLSNDRKWTYSPASACFETEAEETIRTAKVSDVLVKYEATKEHPAQTEIVKRDVVEGFWSTTHYSGAIQRKTKSELIDRLVKLGEAIKIARETANLESTVRDHKFGKSILSYIFGD